MGHAAVRRYVAIFLAALLALAGVLLGLWWAPFVIGVALGALDRRARIVVPPGAAIGLIAWAIPLAAVHIQYGLGPTTRSLAAIMGFDHQGVLPVVLTLLVGTLLGATGAWLASAGRSALTSARTGT
ncbi:MAG: hypothetical protein AUG05_02350 [Actinobacteria bacterium 13_1_20CM_2_66_18]|nr:MAG: hypothetical protein AUG05_02350 [Actinobacteria bacterium 13_1_20CM_2_66_18]